MARLLIDGFEHGLSYLNTLWDKTSYYGLLNPGLTGTYCVNMRGNEFLLLAKTLDAGVASLYAHMRISFTPSSVDVSVNDVNYYGGDEILQATLRMTMQHEASKSTFAILDSAGTEKDTVEIPWQGINSLQIKFSNVSITEKIMELRFNNETVMLEAWTNSAEDNVKTLKWELKGVSHSDIPDVFAVDDIVLDDSDWPGDPKIYALVPTSNGVDSDWTPSVGNNYECVDEIPGSEADYVASIVDDDLDIYGFENLAAAVVSVKSIQVLALAKTPGSPLSEYLQMVVRTGGSDFNSASQKLATERYGYVQAIWETNPDTAIAWTPANINALQAGIQLKSA